MPTDKIKKPCTPMPRAAGDPRPRFRFDSCPGALRYGANGKLYVSDGAEWKEVSLRMSGGRARALS